MFIFAISALATALVVVVYPLITAKKSVLTEGELINLNHILTTLKVIEPIITQKDGAGGNAIISIQHKTFEMLNDVKEDNKEVTSDLKGINESLKEIVGVLKGIIKHQDKSSIAMDLIIVNLGELKGMTKK